MNAPAAVALGALLGAAPASAAIEIDSDSSCPTADMVRGALVALGGVSPPRPAAVSIRDTTDGLQVRFQWNAGRPADVRSVPASADCDQRARAAAVVIASWVGALPAAPAAGPVGPTATTHTAPPPTVVPVEEGRRWWFGLGLGAGSGGGVAPGARLELSRTPAGDRGLGWTVAVQTTLPRSRSVGGGTSSWFRPALMAAAFFAWPVGASVLSADLGPAVTPTFAWGSGYPSNKTDQALSVGLNAGGRLQLGRGPSRPWLEIRLIRWLTAQRLRFDSTASGPVTADLPGTEGFLTLGWSLPVW
jgi:hypothetical protein